jgi:hypothetical protein
MQFGTKFVFKLLAKYAIENILENGQKPSIFSFFQFKILVEFVVGP